MGRVIRNEVVAIACNLRTCTESVAVGPYPVKFDWIDMFSTYSRLVDGGWGVILNDTIRTYCPTHAERVWECSCSTRPDVEQFCPKHSAETQANVWIAGTIPAKVQQEFPRTGRENVMIGTNS